MKTPKKPRACKHLNKDGDKRYVDLAGFCIDCAKQDEPIYMNSHTLLPSS